MPTVKHTVKCMISATAWDRKHFLKFFNINLANTLKITSESLKFWLNYYKNVDESIYISNCLLLNRQHGQLISVYDMTSPVQRYVLLHA